LQIVSLSQVLAALLARNVLFSPDVHFLFSLKLYSQSKGPEFNNKTTID
jgi:hypothetical protein